MQDLFRPADFVSFQVSLTGNLQAKTLLPEAIAKFQVTRVAGLAVGDRFAIESTCATQLTNHHSVPVFQDSLGEWLAIGENTIEDRNEYIVFGDSSGYCPVFYAEHDNHVIVADTFMGVIHGLKYFGAEPTLDIAHYMATVLPSHPHFDNPSVRRTMSSQVQILGIDKALWISETGPQLIERSSLSQDANLSYEQLLERGSALVRNATKELSKVDGLQKVLSLSGGVDSRLVLALIESSGATDEFQLSSVDPRGWKNKNTRDVVERDVSIANEIRTRLGLEWTTVSTREFLQFDFRDSMNFHQSYKSNFAHSFSAPPGHTIQDDLKITYRGGGGELLRTTLTGERIAEQIRNRSWKSSKNLGFTDWYMSRYPMLKAERPLVEEYMAETFQSVPGESITEKLNELYRHTRNRTHFGHVRQSGSTNNYAFHPLSNQHFINASNMLGFEKRSGGQIVRDLFNLNAPNLLNIPFENDNSTREIASPEAQTAQISANNWEESLDILKAKRTSSSARKGWTSDERLVNAPYNKVESSNAFTSQGMKLLEDFVEPEFKKSLRRVNARAFELSQIYPSRSLPLSTKVASALDIFMPSQPAGDHTQLVATATPNDFGATISKVRIKFPTKSQDGWNNQDLPEFSPTIKFESGHVVVNLGLTKVPNTPCEFAVYLYKDNKRVDKSWYGQASTLTFEFKGQGNYYAQVFYRSNSSRRTSLGIKTNELVID